MTLTVSSVGLVTLRPVVEADLPLFLADQLDPESVKMAAFASREEPAFTAHWLKLLADDAVVARTIELDGEAVGHVESFPYRSGREVGYWIMRAYWGRGITSQALAQFLAADELSRPLGAIVARHNRGSRRVLEKCGFVQAGDEILTLPDGETVEMLAFELT